MPTPEGQISGSEIWTTPAEPVEEPKQEEEEKEEE